MTYLNAPEAGGVEPTFAEAIDTWIEMAWQDGSFGWIGIANLPSAAASSAYLPDEGFKEVFGVIVNGTELETQQYISDFKAEFKKMPPEDISFPRGVSDVVKWSDKKTIYTKGTPIHVRGALMYNNAVVSKGLSKRYELIKPDLIQWQRGRNAKKRSGSTN